MTDTFHATTIVSVRRGERVVIGGDGQVTLGNTIMKANARKVRRLGKGEVLAGFAGATADAFTLFELFEQKLEKHGGNLTRAAVELAKDWRTERRLGRLEAFEQRERIGGTAGESAQHLAIAEGPHLACVALHHRVAERDLAVAADGDSAVPPHGEDGRAVRVESF